MANVALRVHLQVAVPAAEIEDDESTHQVRTVIKTNVNVHLTESPNVKTVNIGLLVKYTVRNVKK